MKSLWTASHSLLDTLDAYMRAHPSGGEGRTTVHVDASSLFHYSISSLKGQALSHVRNSLLRPHDPVLRQLATRAIYFHGREGAIPKFLWYIGPEARAFFSFKFYFEAGSSWWAYDHLRLFFFLVFFYRGRPANFDHDHRNPHKDDARAACDDVDLAAAYAKLATARATTSMANGYTHASIQTLLPDRVVSTLLYVCGAG